MGGFDEHYFMYVEDADLTQKMRTTGKAYLVPQYTAIHAWHRAAHRSLKPFLWQTGSLLRYFPQVGVQVLSGFADETKERPPQKFLRRALFPCFFFDLIVE